MSRVYIKEPSISPSRERGAVLAIVLVMLLVVTLVALSTIQSTGLEEKMAANAHFKNIVFQGSESAIETSWNDVPFLGRSLQASGTDTDAGTAGIQVSWPTQAVATSVSNLTITSEAQFLDERKDRVEDNSANSIAIEGGGICYFTYAIRGTATLSSVNSRNTNVQGVYYKGPCRPGSPES